MTEQELFQVPIPPKTETYSPVSHRFIVGSIQERIDKIGLNIVNKQYRTNQKGTQVVGLMDLASGSQDFNYRMAFRNSYDKSMSVAFVGGAVVMICSNGMVVGETQFIRKHTGSVVQELDDKIGKVTAELDNILTKVERQSKQMKNIQVDETATAELCGRFFMEHDIISSSQLNIIRKQLKSPDYKEFEDPNLWSLYNHTTHALKEDHPTSYLNKYKKLHSFVEEEFQLV